VILGVCLFVYAGEGQERKEQKMNGLYVSDARRVLLK